MAELKRNLDLSDAKADDQPLVKRARKIKKRKFALLLCYCGHGYYGLQRNEPFKTIEGEFLRTLHKLNLITKEEYDKPQLFNFQRAARTDKSVSALRQICSCKFPENFPENIDEINNNLPEEIRLLSAIRTTPAFDCRNFCDSRTYSYTFPTFAISPPKTLLSTYYRIDLELINQLNEILSIYKGSHNFHNFTSGKKANENSAMRFIIEINCSQPFMYEEMEFAKITVKGQSFMLHQIRKMIGLAFAIMRGQTTIETVKTCFLSLKRDVPIAPGLGLLLENIHYDAYNRKFTGDGEREPLNWDPLNDKIEEFRKKFIFKVVYDEEKKNFSMINWLENLKYHKNIGGLCDDEKRSWRYENRINKTENNLTETDQLNNNEKLDDKDNLEDVKQNNNESNNKLTEENNKNDMIENKNESINNELKNDNQNELIKDQNEELNKVNENNELINEEIKLNN